MIRPQQEIALRVARDVHSGKTKASVARRLLSTEAKIPDGSAKILIEVYQKMCEGSLFKRHLSRVDMTYFLQSFGGDGNAEALSRALDALRLHIRWREAARASQRSNREILAEQEARFAGLLSEGVTNIAEVNREFQIKVAQALADNGEARRGRLADAPRLPRKITKLVYVYERNADVVAEVERRLRLNSSR